MVYPYFSRALDTDQVYEGEERRGARILDPDTAFVEGGELYEKVVAWRDRGFKLHTKAFNSYPQRGEGGERYPAYICRRMAHFAKIGLAAWPSVSSGRCSMRSLDALYRGFDRIGPTMSKVLWSRTIYGGPSSASSIESCEVGDGADEAFNYLFGARGGGDSVRKRRLKVLFDHLASQDVEPRLAPMAAWVAARTRAVPVGAGGRDFRRPHDLRPPGAALRVAEVPQAGSTRSGRPRAAWFCRQCCILHERRSAGLRGRATFVIFEAYAGGSWYAAQFGAHGAQFSSHPASGVAPERRAARGQDRLGRRLYAATWPSPRARRARRARRALCLEKVSLSAKRAEACAAKDVPHARRRRTPSTTTPSPRALGVGGNLGRRRRRLPGLHERRGGGELPRRVRHGAHLRGRRPAWRGGAAHHRDLTPAGARPHRPASARRGPPARQRSPPGGVLLDAPFPCELAGQRRCHSVALWPLAISQRGAAHDATRAPPGKRFPMAALREL